MQRSLTKALPVAIFPLLLLTSCSQGEANVTFLGCTNSEDVVTAKLSVEGVKDGIYELELNVVTPVDEIVETSQKTIDVKAGAREEVNVKVKLTNGWKSTYDCTIQG